ncbi:MAG: PDZ domain-containing protein [bacterium]
MQYLKLKLSIPFLLLYCIVGFTNSSCMTTKRGSYIVDEQVWENLTWKEDSREDVVIEWKFSKGSRAVYRETQKATVSGEEKATEQDHSLTLEYHVEEVKKDGTARIVLKGKEFSSRGTGYELFKFLLHSSSELGSFSITPSGQMKDIRGLIDIRSLPVFPDNPLKIGSTWTGVVNIAFAPTLPQAIASGECNYQLIGLADVDGHNWAKITFEADVNQPKQEVVIDKIIGVKWAEKPGENGQKVVVSEVIPGTPAEKAGVLRGDIISSFDNMNIQGWSDLASAISLASCDKPVPMSILRNKRKEELMVQPKAVLSGKMESKGKIEGIIVFDVTQGILVRMQIKSFIISSKFIIDDQTTEINATVESLSQLLRLR